MFSEELKNLRKKGPLVHNITNYVTVNDVANILLACGASPIMSDEPKDVFDIVSICNALCINIGTLNERSIESMFIAGKRANEIGIPVVLDPVGAGASGLRTKTATDLLKEIKFSAIRGNISEIKALALGSGSTKGVDADIADAVTENSLDECINYTKSFSKETGAIIAITGKIDLVADSHKCFVIRNGRAEMSKITGTGCQLSAVLSAYIAANPDSRLNAAAAAVVEMGLCGEIVYANLLPFEGNSTYRNRIIDCFYNMSAQTLSDGAKYEIR